MRTRRALLFLGFTLFVVCATHRVSAGGPWEVEGGGYGGSTTGHMACGPEVRAAYGGLGGEVRYSAARAGAGRADAASGDGNAAASEGFAFDVGGLVERERAWPLACAGSDCSRNAYAGLAPSARARVGYDGNAFGFRLGAILWTQPQNGQPLEMLPVPDLALRFGALDSVRFVAGFGAYDLPSYLRPGLYCGLLVPTGRGWELGGHVGAHYALADTLDVREAVTARAPLARHLWLRADFALMQNEYGPGSDAVIGVGGEL